MLLINDILKLLDAGMGKEELASLAAGLGEEDQANPNHPGDNIRENGTSQKWTRPGMPPDAGGILRGCPLLGGAICPNVVSGVDLKP